MSHVSSAKLQPAQGNSDPQPSAAAMGAHQTTPTGRTPFGITNDTQAFDATFPLLPPAPLSRQFRPGSRPSDQALLLGHTAMDDHDHEHDLPPDFPPSLLSPSSHDAQSKPTPAFNPESLLTFPSMDTSQSLPPSPPDEQQPKHSSLSHSPPRHGAPSTVNLALDSLAPAAMHMTADLSASSLPNPAATHPDHQQIMTSPSPNSAESTADPSGLRSQGSSMPPLAVNPDMLYDTPMLDYMYDSNNTQMPTSSPLTQDLQPDKFLVLTCEPSIQFPLHLGYNILGLNPKNIDSQAIDLKYPQHLITLPAHLNGISRTHAIIHLRKDGRVFIHDCKSKNGTFLDPLPTIPDKTRRVTPLVVDVIHVGEHIRLASHVFTLQSTADQAPATASGVAPTSLFTAGAFVCEPTPPGLLTPALATVLRTLSSTSTSSGTAAAAPQGKTSAEGEAGEMDASTLAHHGSVLQPSLSPLAAAAWSRPKASPAPHPRGVKPAPLRRLSDDGKLDPIVQAFVRDLPPIKTFERKRSWSAARGAAAEEAERVGVAGMVGQGARSPLAVSSQTQREPEPRQLLPSSQVNANGFGSGFASPGLSPITALSRRILAHCRSSDGSAEMEEMGDDASGGAGEQLDEGDVDLVPPRPVSGRTSRFAAFGVTSRFGASRLHATASPLPPLPAQRQHPPPDESMDLMDADPTNLQDSCTSTASRLRICDGAPLSSLSPVLSLPVRQPMSPPRPPSNHVPSADSAVERSVLSPTGPGADSVMQLPPQPHLLGRQVGRPSEPSSSASPSTSSSLSRRKPANPQRHASFSSSCSPTDDSGSASDALATGSVGTSEEERPAPEREGKAGAGTARALPRAKRSKTAGGQPVAPAAADAVQATVPAPPRGKRTWRGTAVPAPASVTSAAITSDSPPTDDGSGTSDVEKEKEERRATRPPPAKRARTAASGPAADVATEEAKAGKRPERKAKATARTTAGELAATEAQFNADLRAQLRRAKASKERCGSGVVAAGRRAEKHKEESDSGEEESGMDTDEAPSPPTPSKRGAATKSKAKGKGKAAAKVEPAAAPGASRRGSGSKAAAATPDAPYVVLFTGGSKSAHDADGALVTQLYGRTTDAWQDANVLVVDKVRRTVKFLCSLAAGIDVVSTAWLAASKKAKRLVPTAGYELVDRSAESKFGFSLAESVERRKRASEEEGRVFSGLRFFLCSGTMPVLHDMKEIIEAAGGIIAHSIPNSRAPSSNPAEQGLVAIAGDGVADADQRKRLNDLGYALHSAEFVLSGVLKQEVRWDTYRVEEVTAAPASSETGRVTRRGRRSG